MNTNFEIEKTIKNFETYKNICSDIYPARSSKINKMLTTLAEEIMITPNSTRIDYNGAYPGGMIEHALLTHEIIHKLNVAIGGIENKAEMSFVALFHNLGKVGSVHGTEFKAPYYIQKNSDWHNKQGIMYDINEANTPMSSSLRTLYTLQSFGISISESEYSAISSIKDFKKPGDDSIPVSNEPMLAVLLQQASKHAAMKLTGKTTTKIYNL